MLAKTFAKIVQTFSLSLKSIFLFSQKQLNFLLNLTIFRPPCVSFRDFAKTNVFAKMFAQTNIFAKNCQIPWHQNLFTKMVPFYMLPTNFALFVINLIKSQKYLHFREHFPHILIFSQAIFAKMRKPHLFVSTLGVAFSFLIALKSLCMF